MKESKVAICPKCTCFVLACHIDYLNNETEKEFKELSDEGFEVKLETTEETKTREYSSYNKCIEGKCLKSNCHE